jgi:hypothetical protein
MIDEPLGMAERLVVYCLRGSIRRTRQRLRPFPPLLPALEAPTLTLEGPLLRPTVPLPLTPGPVAVRAPTSAPVRIIPGSLRVRSLKEVRPVMPVVANLSPLLKSRSLNRARSSRKSRRKPRSLPKNPNPKLGP